MRSLSGVYHAESGAETSIKPDAMIAGMATGPSDVVGMLAYAIYAQFREDWRCAFRETFGRVPDEHEQRVFDVGESTARRKMTYRFLADARVTGSYGETRGRATDRFVQKVYAAGAKEEAARQQPRRASNPRRLALGLLLAIGATAIVSFAMNFAPRSVIFASTEASRTP